MKSTYPLSLEEHRARLLRVATARVGEDAEDVVQNAMVKTWRFYDPTKSALRTYIGNVLNACIMDSFKRKRLPMAYYPEEDAEDEPVDLAVYDVDYEDRVWRRDVRAAVYAVNYECGAVLDCKLAGCTSLEIMGMLNLSKDAYCKRIRRIKKILIRKEFVCQ